MRVSMLLLILLLAKRVIINIIIIIIITGSGSYITRRRTISTWWKWKTWRKGNYKLNYPFIPFMWCLSMSGAWLEYFAALLEHGTFKRLITKPTGTCLCEGFGAVWCACQPVAINYITGIKSNNDYHYHYYRNRKLYHQKEKCLLLMNLKKMKKR